MSPACYHHFLLLTDIRPPRELVDETTRTARLIFAAIMGAPDLRAEPRSGGGL
jgi:hypothetical protein